jgi:hypothetical protein
MVEPRPIRLEDGLLAGRLEILLHRLLKRGLILRHQPAHAVELFNSPFAATRDAGCKVALVP